jgi:hypothetical protein
LSSNNQLKAEVFAVAYQSQTSPRQRLAQLLDALGRFYFDEQGGCLMGLVGMEVATRQPAFTRTIKHFFLDWIEAFSQLLQTQYPQAEASELVQRAVQ